MILTLEPRTRFNPLWWRVPAWVAVIAVSVVQTHTVAGRIAAGLLMTVSAVAMQFLSAADDRLRLGALLLATATGLAACLIAHDGVAEVLVVVAATRAARCLAGRRLWWYAGVTGVAFGVVIAVISMSLPGALAGLGIPLLVQRSLEQQLVVRERDRAEALLAEVQGSREAETQAAALRERGRIAREMHDVLAHSLAGLSVQLQAVRAVAARAQVGPAVLEPLDRAAALARDGLVEARAAVSALRDPVGYGIADLPGLVDRHPGHATLVDPGPAGTVAPDAGHAVYRAVQESLTNAARYAPGSPVVVTVSWRPAMLTVTVTDDGPAPGRSAVAGQGTGLGLAGMSERAREAGGTVRCGPRPGGGWQTTVEVPAREIA